MSTAAGAALLVDVQRRMTLFAEAISGGPALLAPIEQLQQHYRADVFTSDGKHYWLPALIDGAPDFLANYARYRVALVHQIGYQLYGTFDFSLSQFRRRHPNLFPADGAAPKQSFDYSRTQALDLERLFSSQSEAPLMRMLFAIVEGWRIDRHNYRQFPGLRSDLAEAMSAALATRPAVDSLTPAQATLEALIAITLHDPAAQLDSIKLAAEHHWLIETIRVIAQDEASVYDAAAVALTLHRTLLVAGDLPAILQRLPEPTVTAGASQLPVPSDKRPSVSSVQYRGEPFALPALASRRRLAADAVVAASAAGTASSQTETDEAELANPSPTSEQKPDTKRPTRERQVLIDEWDYLNRQTLKGWCCLREYRLEGSPGAFKTDLLKRYRENYERIKRQFNTLRPEAIRLQRGLPDGESIELDRAIERFADRRAGLPGDDRLYQRRDRAERDVAAAFLIDMSASTDFQVNDPLNPTESEQADPAENELDDIGWSPYDAMQLKLPNAGRPKRRVIDIARESLGLITAVLQDLGDRFALYGYSGQGRHRVSFGVAKEFDEACSSQTWGALAAIEPQGSSRMGAPIRHAGAKLAKVIAKIKVMIIVSDGYPQDIDYGPDRTSEEYGLQDTARAIEEVTRMGVQVFCLSVDPGGNDYLRRVCAPDHYLVIDEVSDLPLELIKVYRGLT